MATVELNDVCFKESVCGKVSSLFHADLTFTGRSWSRTYDSSSFSLLNLGLQICTLHLVFWWLAFSLLPLVLPAKLLPRSG